MALIVNADSNESEAKWRFTGAQFCEENSAGGWQSSFCDVSVVDGVLS